MSGPIRTYIFESPVGRGSLQILAEKKTRIITNQINDAPPSFSADGRIGSFDNQGSSKPWTWGWTTDGDAFECWRPSGLRLRLENQEIALVRSSLFGQRITKIPAAKIKSLVIGKTGALSIGLIGLGYDGQSYSLLKDTYPVMNATFNVTYDGICKEEDLFPFLMMGRELAKRLTIAIDESLADVKKSG